MGGIALHVAVALRSYAHLRLAFMDAIASKSYSHAINESEVIMAAFPTANKNQLVFVDIHTGVAKRYISREGNHPKTGKPLSDIFVFDDGKAVNWPKVADKETGEVRPWDFFDPSIDLEHDKVTVGWNGGQFVCRKAK